MRRFFIDHTQISKNTALLIGPEARHITTVLRLKPGQPIQLFDGSGTCYEARISSICRDRVEAEILRTAIKTTESGPCLYLGQALAKGKKMDFIVQKATELGVASILPFACRYSIPGHAADERQELRQQRWARIAREACKQCGRPVPPLCRPPVDFEVLLAATVAQDDLDLKLLFWEDDACVPLSRLTIEPAAIRAAMILIGPEGGFSRDEAEAAIAAGFTTVSLGRRILRTETAALVAVAILQYLLGNLE
ncbi:MAG: hypothetical protein A2521_03175 [Deltaproteobacteria bacterium RIFOXYD12_FULL_57_12]|nr:MAG: hypothetical protein A2521_03175 [Deltaproteobacteria bacterium RIFOXYD12_FULL_57_12]